MRSIRVLIIMICPLLGAGARGAACPPAGFTRAQLVGIKSAKFEITSVSARNTLARGLVACLDNPDPELRDAIAFEALSHYLRADQLSDETKLSIRTALLDNLKQPDEAGFRQPFAALTLSEIARADRIKPYMTARQREELLSAAIAYFVQVRDYRGFNEKEGWRHGVAHGADLLMQLALNPEFGRTEIDRILAALVTQIAPREIFYIYGESERLARVVTVSASRGLLSEREWAAWLKRIAEPAPLSSWDDAFSSQAGLARVHDVKAFVSRLVVVAELTPDKNAQSLRAGARQAMLSLP